MEPATGFAVTGDTSTIHAGSYGVYVVYLANGVVAFSDKTFPTTGIPTKYHLSGLYGYHYDGTNFQISYYSPLDTLALVYNLKKTGN
jgi:hypothetical protein